MVTDERRCISFETIPPFEAGFLSVRHTGGHYHPTLASFRNLALREPLHIGHYANVAINAARIMVMLP
jgi:hypothetical protein